MILQKHAQLWRQGLPQQVVCPTVTLTTTTTLPIPPLLQPNLTMILSRKHMITTATMVWTIQIHSDVSKNYMHKSMVDVLFILRGTIIVEKHNSI